MTSSRLSTLSRRTFLLATAALAAPALAQALDHRHTAWTTLLKKHVVLLDGGKASQLRYAGMAADGVALKGYLAALSAVGAIQFAAFSKAQQQAFLSSPTPAARRSHASAGWMRRNSPPSPTGCGQR